MKTPFPHHFTSITQLNKESILCLLSSAENLLNQYILPNQVNPILRGKLIANLFFEPSTRTCNSFEIAAQRLGAMLISPSMQSSSLLKGESLLDTIHTFEAMGVNALVVRHHENGIMSWLAQQLSEKTGLINAGEGHLQHPTQTLLDLLTIQQHRPDWQNLSVAIVGDLKHSRVSRSLVDGLSIMGVSDIRLVAPAALQTEINAAHQSRVTAFTQLDQGIKQADVVVCLRLQKERMDNTHTIDEKEFHENFCVTRDRLKQAKPHALVMHPGPMNRGIEISSEVADGPQSVILSQVKNGVAVRMAVLQKLFE